MTNKTTRRAFLASLMALLLCVSSLLGTTYAWFTDSVTSGSNIIKSGNLDVVVEYTLDGETWEDLQGANDLFQKGLWEPGHTEVVALRIKNNGTLALKYSANMNIVNETIGKTKDDIDIVLSEILMVSTLTFEDAGIDPVFGINIAERSIEEAFKSENGIGYNAAVPFKTTNVLSDGVKTLLPGVVQYVVIKVDMDANIGNEANHDGINIPTIEFGVNILATQTTAENDTFGNQYDANAWTEVAEVPTPDANGVVNVYTAEQLAGVMGNTTGIKVINIIEDIDLAGRTWVPAFVSAPDLVINGKGHTISNMTTSGDNNVGFIGAAYQNITINDLTFKNAKVQATGSFVGGVIGNAWDHADITFNNVDLVDSEVSTTIPNKAIRVGGLIGYSPYTRGDLTLNGCDVTGSTITGYHNVGAMVGTTMFYGPEQGTITIANCTAKNNTLKYGSSNVGAFAFGASTSGYTEYIPASGFTAENNKQVAVITSTTDALNQAIEKGATTIEVPAGTYTFPATNLSAAQTLICAPGTVFEGAKLNANGATVVGATFSGTASSNTVNGIYKDCTFTGANGLRYGYVGETAVFENCVFSGNTYGIHFDGGANEVIFKNCIISGFNATAAAVTKVTFEGCTFVGNGKSAYNGINLWGDGDFKDCTFVFDGSSTYEWIDLCSGGKTAKFENCVVNDGTNTSNVSTLIGDKLTKRETSGKIIVDGVELTY